MNREIKFRMWRDGRMQGVHTMYSKMSDTDSPVEPQNFAFSEEEVLMQYIGLKDKNGKEIYEGDIEMLGYVIGWHEKRGCFGLFRNGMVMSYPLCDDDLTIIGNIYQNPDLLK